MGFGGADSSIIWILRGGIPRPIGNFPESLSQAMLVGVMLVGSLGVDPGRSLAAIWTIVSRRVTTRLSAASIKLGMSHSSPKAEFCRKLGARGEFSRLRRLHLLGPCKTAGRLDARADFHVYGDLIIISPTMISEKPWNCLTTYLARGMNFKFVCLIQSCYC